MVGDDVIVNIDSSSSEDESVSFLYNGDLDVDGIENDFQISAEEVGLRTTFCVASVEI